MAEQKLHSFAYYPDGDLITAQRHNDILGDEEILIAHVYHYDKDAPAYIVRACNGYPAQQQRIAELLEACEIAEKIMNHAWQTVDAICGADHMEPLPINNLPKDRQELVYELASFLADNGETVATAIAKAKEAVNAATE